MKSINKYIISEQYTSNNDLYKELYNAIKPIFKRFGIIEKYWADNLEGFISDIKKQNK